MLHYMFQYLFWHSDFFSFRLAHKLIKFFVVVWLDGFEGLFWFVCFVCVYVCLANIAYAHMYKYRGIYAHTYTHINLNSFPRCYTPL